MFDKIFQNLLVQHPRTGEKDPLLSIVVFLAVICGLKFFLDGVTVNILGHVINFGHVDSMSYGSLLGPALGGHAFVDTRDKLRSPSSLALKPDNPDEGEEE